MIIMSALNGSARFAVKGMTVKRTQT